MLEEASSHLFWDGKRHCMHLDWKRAAEVLRYSVLVGRPTVHVDAPASPMIDR